MDQNHLAATAFVFPGQGAQTIGMLADFASRYRLITDSFNEASDYLGYDLWGLVQNGPETELNRTEITQPALLVAGVSLWRLWCENAGSLPGYMAGHSLGEYTALVCSGSIKFEDAVTLVRDRGIYMQAAVSEGEGAMAAIIGIDRDIIEKVCTNSSVDGQVSAANYNSPEQTVIAGQIEAVNKAMDLAKEAGAKRTILLPVSVPSHCGLMQPAAKQLAKRLNDINISDATIPVIQNVDARPHKNADEIKGALVKQLHQPVLWVDTVHRIAELGCKTIIVSGPGKVLSGMIKRITRDINVMNLNSIDAFDFSINKK